ncbi:MAG: hypothetical protein CYPHOPRED_005368 [Cyphobasidiales sp. Tagirdzhanova-0007]|nr:MAG: hypothetical protein CYPHOPRED_005368 [Cyphobasidiales sp. Tagirdzhanova-0007]
MPVLPTSTSQIYMMGMLIAEFISGALTAISSPSSAPAFKKPRYLTSLSGQSFRDLALHETYAVAVTPNGDLLQWGLGYSRKPSQPSPTLKGQDIVQVALTPSKIYARTKGGKVLILPVSQADQTDTSAGKVLPTVSWFWKAFGYRDPGVHFVTMSAANPDRVKMKISHISAGRSHLLAMAEDGRACCAAVDGNANEMGQLGGGQKLLDAISSKAGNGGDPIVLEKAIEFDTTLKEIPALRNLKVDQLVSGDRHSLALTTEGRVLGWGNNSLGQLALGTSYAFPAIPAPTECALTASYSKSSRIRCQSIYAGGDTSYFLVTREDLRTPDASLTPSGDRRVYQDVLAAGSGIYGGIGNGQYFSTGIPLKVKTVSGLQEWNEGTQSVEAIPVHDISVNSTHAAVVLSNALHDPHSKQSFGNDVFVFGHNADYQLGTGKRSNLAIPQHIPPLPYPLTAAMKEKLNAKATGGGAKAEESLGSGTVSHMPHNRLQLAPRKNNVEERIVCGYGTTAVYWRVDK